jgi:glycosyltransferase involved in cell wall biosynthesis
MGLPRRLHIVHTESSGGWGGQDMRVLAESVGLTERGHRVTIVTAGRHRLHQEALKAGVPAVDLPLLTKRPKDFLALRRWLAANADDIDIINTHSSTDAWLTAAVGITLRKMPPVIRTRHISAPISRASRRWIYQRSVCHLVTTGEAMRQWLHRDHGIPLEHMTSVPTGIDLRRFMPRERVEARRLHGLAGGPLTGILAMLSHFKGHRDLFAALKILRERQPEMRLLVIGDGPNRQTFEAEVLAHGLADAVRFVGYVADAETWLPALDIFVHPSTANEGVPQSVLQAMACELPVITTGVGSLPDAVRHEETGLVVPKGDPAAIVAAITRLQRDPALAAQLARAGRAHVERHFSRTVMLDRMESLFLRHARRRRADA